MKNICIIRDNYKKCNSFGVNFYILKLLLKNSRRAETCEEKEVDLRAML